MSSANEISELYTHYLSSKSVTTDSRHIAPQSIFFALKGARFDGNAFAEQALQQGASYAVIDDPSYQKDERYILVEDALDTLQKLANHHRQQLSIPVLAITGSSGKTTTKELIKAVLQQRYKTTATQGNLNNHIGVPLTLLSIDDSTEIAVVEMGANHVGEIAQLCKIAVPTHGIITNVGHVHIEGFGSFEGVVRGKTELYEHLLAHHGKVFINSTDPILGPMGDRFDQPIYYPQAQDFYHCELVAENPYIVYKSEGGISTASQLLGSPHFYNIAAALCIGKYFQVNEQKANQAVESYKPSNNRSELIKKGSNVIFLDAYNSNLFSAKEAVRALQRISAEHKVLILGDMEELGDESEAAHRDLVDLTAQAPYKAVLICGPKMIAAKEANPSAHYFQQKDDLATYLAEHKFEHTAFLIKASRSMQLDTLVEVIS